MDQGSARARHDTDSLGLGEIPCAEILFRLGVDDLHPRGPDDRGGRAVLALFFPRRRSPRPPAGRCRAPPPAAPWSSGRSCRRPRTPRRTGECVPPVGEQLRVLRGLHTTQTLAPGGSVSTSLCEPTTRPPPSLKPSNPSTSACPRSPMAISYPSLAYRRTIAWTLATSGQGRVEERETDPLQLLPAPRGDAVRPDDDEAAPRRLAVLRARIRSRASVSTIPGLWISGPSV